ncbi:MAG: IS701 family transposase [Steroidobacteraceae bacterium]
MAKLSQLEKYMEYVCEALGHADRHTGFADYGRALMLPIERKSVEPLAAHVEPWNVPAKHQSLHHVVAQSAWSDEAVLARVREWVSPALKVAQGCYWIVDDTGFPKKGKHSVGVARQYCGQVGKQDNCQVAVSLSLASEEGSVPMTWRLYLPQEWADDKRRREKAGVPEQVEFATKNEIALAQIRSAKGAGVPVGVVLADAAYGNDTGFREAVSAMELDYCVGVQSSSTVWTGSHGPRPPQARKNPGRGRPASRLRRDPKQPPQSAKEVALSLPSRAWRTVSWREGTNYTLRSRFAALRVRVAHRDYKRTRERAAEWLLIEWPHGEAEPRKYWLSSLPAKNSLRTLAHTAKARWRIERDYQELKQEFGLGHYEGRGWRGFHHHASLCIAAYGFLLDQRLKSGDSKKNSARSKAFALPAGYKPRGSRQDAAPRSRLHRHSPIPVRSSSHPASGSVSMLREAHGLT